MIRRPSEAASDDIAGRRDAAAAAATVATTAAAAVAAAAVAAAADAATADAAASHARALSNLLYFLDLAREKRKAKNTQGYSGRKETRNADYNACVKVVNASAYENIFRYVLASL